MSSEKEKIKERKRKHYLKNKEKYLQKSKEWRKNNPKEFRAIQRKYQRSEKYKEYKRKYQKSKKYKEWLKKYLQSEKTKERLEKYSKSETIINYKKSQAHKDSIKKYKNSKKGKIAYKRKDLKKKERLGRIVHLFTVEEWFELKESTQGYCPSCDNYIGIDNLQLDHIHPISKAKENQIYTINDIQPLCSNCNIIKGNKIIEKYHGQYN